MPLGIGGDQPSLDGRGRLEAKDLLDGVGNEVGLGNQLVTLIGVFGQELARPADSRVVVSFPAPASSPM
ncbi:MAG TPA: hypothetical protein VGF11_06865 [Acidimicrobiales bacterium]